MRAYFWGNMYLSAIQQGIQSLHCLSEMYVKYTSMQGGVDQTTANSDLFEWAKNHKTVVVLNAGESVSLAQIRTEFQTGDPDFAWAHWNESSEALHGALTSVGVILPERVYMAAREIKKNWRDRNLPKKLGLTDFEIYLCELINSTYMAR